MTLPILAFGLSDDFILPADLPSISEISIIVLSSPVFQVPMRLDCQKREYEKIDKAIKIVIFIVELLLIFEVKVLT